MRQTLRITEESGGEHNASKCRKAVVLSFTIFEALFYGGSIMGWPSIVYVLKSDGIFSELCVDGGTYGQDMNGTTPMTPMTTEVNAEWATCEAQDLRLALVFTVGMIAQGLLAFPSGTLFDYSGLRVTKTFVSIMILASMLILAFVAQGETSYLLFIVGPCLCLSLCLMNVLGCHVGLYAGRKASSYACLLNGAINVSAAVFLVVKVLADHGISRMYSLGVLSVVYLSSPILTWTTFPAYKVGMRRPRRSPPVSQPSTELSVIDTQFKERGVDSKTSGPGAGQAVEVATFKSCVFSTAALLHFMWFSLLHLRSITYVVSFNPWVTTIVQGDSAQVSHFTNIYGYIQIAAQIICPIPGGLIDFQVNLLPKELVGFGRSVAAAPSVTICSLLYLLASAATLLPGHAAVYISMVCSEVARCFLYGVAVAYIQLTFPMVHFGKITGLAFLANGIASALQYPLLSWTYGGTNYDPLNIFLVVMTSLTLIHPIITWVRYPRVVK